MGLLKLVVRTVDIWEGEWVVLSLTGLHMDKHPVIILLAPLFREEELVEDPLKCLHLVDVFGLHNRLLVFHGCLSTVYLVRAYIRVELICILRLHAARLLFVENLLGFVQLLRVFDLISKVLNWFANEL